MKEPLFTILLAFFALLPAAGESGESTVNTWSFEGEVTSITIVAGSEGTKCIESVDKTVLTVEAPDLTEVEVECTSDFYKCACTNLSIGETYQFDGTITEGAGNQLVLDVNCIDLAC